MRESASPSEGVEGLVEMEMRLYGICAPSEGEWKMRESASPSEGVEGLVEREMRLQAFSGRCPICAPSEGERKMRERVSPSEGGTGQGRVRAE